MIRRLLTALAIAAVSFGGAAQAANFSDWAAIVVAGDHQDHDGNDSEVFDNARRAGTTPWTAILSRRKANTPR